MEATIEIPNPPDGYEIIGHGPAQGGDMHLTAQGWMLATPGYFLPIRARRKRVGLVESFDAIWDKVTQADAGWCQPVEQFRARLAEIDAREIGQGGDK